MEKKTVLIVGLGLIGGSLALALSRSEAYTVVGTDRCLETLEQALDAGAIARPADAHNWSEADVVVLCVSPSAAVSLLSERVGDLRSGTVVTDVCGVKQPLVSRCEALCRPHGVHFVGAHPMAGKERSGFAHAEATLFRSCSYRPGHPGQPRRVARDPLRRARRDLRR